MPELLEDGLPERVKRPKFDFAQWADGRAWKFLKGRDYSSTTESFRYNVRQWAKANGYEVECQPFPALDRDGREIPLTKMDPIGLGVCFHPTGNGTAPAGNGRP